MASDKHLDAEWKRIQEKTFTRWCNEHLKAKLMKIENLSQDLSDGVKLVVLLELLSQKKLGRYNKKARIHAQKMENNQLALDFITKKERIKLVNIGECVATQESKQLLVSSTQLLLSFQCTAVLYGELTHVGGVMRRYGRFTLQSQHNQ